LLNLKAIVAQHAVSAKAKTGLHPKQKLNQVEAKTGSI
jgi:hypothetical protein